MIQRAPMILVVDDDPDTREMYTWALEARGFRVVGTATAAAAAAVAIAQRPDVVVSDFTLPGDDGFALGARLRDTPELAETPMILVSGRAFLDGAGERARELFDRVLLKPVLPDQLIAEIVALLLDRTTAGLQRELRDVRARLAGVAPGREGDVLAAVTGLTGSPAPPAAMLCGGSAEYIAVNDAACELTGRSREDLLRLRVWDLTGGATLAEGREQWAPFVAAGTLTGSYVLRAPDGAPIPTRFAASANVLPGLHLSLLRPLPSALQLDI